MICLSVCVFGKLVPGRGTFGVLVGVVGLLPPELPGVLCCAADERNAAKMKPNTKADRSLVRTELAIFVLLMVCAGRASPTPAYVTPFQVNCARESRLD